MPRFADLSLTGDVAKGHLFILKNILHLSSEAHWLGSYYAVFVCANAPKYFRKKSQTIVWTSKHEKLLARERTKNKLKFVFKKCIKKKKKYYFFWSSIFLSPNSLSYFSPEEAQSTYLMEFDKYLEYHEKDVSYCQPVIRVDIDLESHIFFSRLLQNTLVACVQIISEIVFINKHPSVLLSRW